MGRGIMRLYTPLFPLDFVAEYYEPIINENEMYLGLSKFELVDFVSYDEVAKAIG